MVEDEEDEVGTKWTSQELSLIYVSLARTLQDCGQYSQALHYYHKELKLCRGKPVEVWNGDNSLPNQRTSMHACYKG